MQTKSPFPSTVKEVPVFVVIKLWGQIGTSIRSSMGTNMFSTYLSHGYKSTNLVLWGFGLGCRLLVINTFYLDDILFIFLGYLRTSFYKSYMSLSNRYPKMM